MLGTNYTPFIVEGLISSAYAVELKSKSQTSIIGRSRSDKYRSPIQYNDFDNLLGDDFNFVIESLYDSAFADVEKDLLSVWSSNKSEQES